MLHRAKDLSPDQKSLLEGLLGYSVSENETISIRAIGSASAPEWLQSSWNIARQAGVDQISAQEIDAEIEAARKQRRSRESHHEQ